MPTNTARRRTLAPLQCAPPAPPPHPAIAITPRVRTLSTQLCTQLLKRPRRQVSPPRGIGSVPEGSRRQVHHPCRESTSGSRPSSSTVPMIPAATLHSVSAACRTQRSTTVLKTPAPQPVCGSLHGCSPVVLQWWRAEEPDRCCAQAADRLSFADHLQVLWPVPPVVLPRAGRACNVR